MRIGLLESFADKEAIGIGNRHSLLPKDKYLMISVDYMSEVDVSNAFAEYSNSMLAALKCLEEAEQVLEKRKLIEQINMDAKLLR